MTALLVIPARYASSRYPGKPLARETGKFLIQHVVEQARKVPLVSEVVVATDDARIFEAVGSFGGKAVMTAEAHESGTDRIAEVVRMAEFRGVEIVVNVQGDEPEVEPGLVNGLIEVLRDRPGTQMATTAARFERMEDVGNPNMVKVVVDREGHALYFSRSVIPYDRDGEMTQGGRAMPYWKHLGLYAYRRKALLRLADAAPCALERLEKLEQLRALYLGMKIHVTETSHAAHGIDTPADYAAFLKRYNEGRSAAISSR